MNKFIVMLAAVAAIMFAGCSSSKTGKTGVDGDSIYGEDLIGVDGGVVGGEYVMDGERFENYTPVNEYYMPVYFDYNKYAIPQAEIEKISALAQYLKEKADYLLVIEGNCDERGTIEYNISLGEYRAQSVRDCLIQFGIDAARIQTSSKGEENPVDFGHNEAAWKKNRRAEFFFFKR